jgi:hypothetical protein
MERSDYGEICFKNSSSNFKFKVKKQLQTHPCAIIKWIPCQARNDTETFDLTPSFPTSHSLKISQPAPSTHFDFLPVRQADA